MSRLRALMIMELLQLRVNDGVHVRVCHSEASMKTTPITVSNTPSRRKLKCVPAIVACVASGGIGSRRLASVEKVRTKVQALEMVRM